MDIRRKGGSRIKKGKEGQFNNVPPPFIPPHPPAPPAPPPPPLPSLGISQFCLGDLPGQQRYAVVYRRCEGRRDDVVLNQEDLLHSSVRGRGGRTKGLGACQTQAVAGGVHGVTLSPPPPSPSTMLSYRLRVPVPDGAQRAHVVAGGVHGVTLPRVDGHHQSLVHQSVGLACLDPAKGGEGGVGRDADERGGRGKQGGRAEDPFEPRLSGG